MPRDDEGNSTRALIVETAKKLFFEQGVTHTSTTDVAGRSYMARNSVRYYFKTKKDMHRAVSDDILNRLVGVTVKKLRLDKINWIIMSFVFWYRFFHDNRFREYNLQCIGKINAANEVEFQCVYEFMYRPFDGNLSYSEFVEQNYLALELSWNIDEWLMQYYSSRLEQMTYLEAATNELLLTLRLFGIPDALIYARIDDALEILSSLDLQKMGEELG